MPFYILPETLSDSDQEVLRNHDDVPEYQERLKKAGADRMHQGFSQVAKQVIRGGDQIADVGAGLGAVAQLLVKQGHTAYRIGNDISYPYLAHAFNAGVYDDCWVGTAEAFSDEMDRLGKQVDWVTMISVTYYFTPERLLDVLTRLARICRKGVVLTLEGIPDALRQKWQESEKPVLTYNHQGQTDLLFQARFASVETAWSGIGWASSSTGIDVPIDVVILRREP